MFVYEHPMLNQPSVKSCNYRKVGKYQQNMHLFLAFEMGSRKPCSGDSNCVTLPKLYKGRELVDTNAIMTVIMGTGHIYI